MKPIIPHKYDVEFKIENCDLKVLNMLEPWCDRITDLNQETVEKYIEMEQSNTIIG